MNRKAYILEPLKDPATEIRLLNSEGSRGGTISLRTTVWTAGRASCPKFNAISYTWGDADNVLSILLNGQEFWVRKNCYHTLEQALALYPSSYLWIDSICINQDDVEEKNAQVAQMGRIYHDAEYVLSCLGPHADGSELIFPLAREIHRLWTLPLEDNPWADDTRNTYLSQQSYVLSHSKAKVESFVRALEAFAARPYWSRVWIVQEVNAAIDCQILCGADQISWHELSSLNTTLTSLARKTKLVPEINTYFISNLFRVKSQRPTLHTVPLYFRNYRCSDVRDRCYGLLSIMDWYRGGGDGRAKLTADYGISSLGLLATISRILHGDGPWVLRTDGWREMLQVGADQPDMLAAVERRRCVRTPSPTGTLHCETRSYNRNASGVLIEQIRSSAFEEGEYILCHEPENFRSEDLSWAALELLGMLQTMENDPVGPMAHFVGRRPNGVLVKGTLAFLVCSDAVEGDYLVSYGHRLMLRRNPPHHLVLRHNSAGGFNIVGQAIALDQRFSSSESNAPEVNTRSETRRLEVEFNLNNEDMVVLELQDVIGAGVYDMLARLKRLITNPTLLPIRAARIIRERERDIDYRSTVYEQHSLDLDNFEDDFTDENISNWFKHAT